MSIRHSEFLTTREVAELLLVSTATVRLWAKKGLLPVHSHTPGGHRRFLRADVEGLRKANTEVGGGAVAWLEPDPGAAAARFRAVIESATQAMLVLGEDGAILHANPAFGRLSGYTAVQLADMRLADLIHGGRSESTRNAAKRGQVPVRLIRHDGTSFEARLRFVTLARDRADKAERLAVIEDVSGQRRGDEERRLRQRQERQLFTRSRAAGLLVDPVDGAIVDANEAAERFYGYPRERLLSLNISDLNVLSPADIEQEMVEANRQGRGYLRLPHRLSSGETRQVEVHEGPVDGPRGSLLYCVVHDVSGWVEAEKRLRQVAAVFETSDEGVMITDADLRILSVNHAFSQITGYTKDEVIGRTPEFLGAGVHDKHFFRRILGELAGSGRWQGDVWNRRKSGEVCPEWLSLSAVEGADSTVENYIWVFADVSDIKRTRTKLEYIAHHDPLTDLPNRLLFNTRLKHALDRAQRGVNQLAVLLLDLDRFKNINDSFGHPVGDLLLSMAAGRMQSCLRREDTMARIGGDEFAVLLEGIDDGKAAARVADKLIQALAPSFHLKGVETFITASIGIAVYPLDGQTSTKLMRNADAALFVAKGEGRNTFRYYRREMTADVRERLTMEAALRRAIDNDEFEVWYQPQVNR